MSSPLLALFIRSLREDSRLRFTYFARSGLVLVILLFLFTVQQSMGWSNAPGLHFFGTVVGLDLVFVILAGVSYFAASVSEEKEEMTLGLLRMTNLNPLSILLGKSTSRLCAAALLFAAQIPFTMLAITLGGISLHQVSAAYLSLAAFLFFVSNLALFASVICRRTGAAGALTGATLFLFFAIVPALGRLVRLPFQIGLIVVPSTWVRGIERLGEIAEAASPFTRFSAILSTGFRGSAFSFQVGSNLALGLLFFLLAWALFENFCSEQKELAPGRNGLSRNRRRFSALSPGRAWRRALAWKDFYFLTGGKLWIAIKIIIYGLPLAAARFWPEKLNGPPSWRDFGLAMFWMMAGLIGIELAIATANIFRVERQGQTLSSLAMLPQGIRRVAYEKLLGVLPALTAAGLYFVLSLPLVAPLFEQTWREFSWNRRGDRMAFFVITFMIFQAVFFLHLVANLSLRVKRGALPLAIGIHFLLAMFVGVGSIAPFRGDSGLFLLYLATIGATIFLHIDTGRRLEMVAAEE